MKRKKIINLHGTQELTIEKAQNAEMQLGEIAVKNGSIKGESELYVLTDNGETQSIDTFITKDAVEKHINSKVFIGTLEQYNEANSNGSISIGALVIILDENEINGSNTSAELGQAIIGTLLLGKK